MTTRREFLGAAATGPFVPLTSIETQAVDDTLSQLVTANATLAGFSSPDEVIEFGASANPSWHIEYSEDKRESLSEWVDASDDRSIISEHEGSRSMTISAPPSDIGVAWLDRVRNNALAARDYVETVDLNVSMGYAEPIQHLDSEDVWGSVTALERALLSTRLASAPQPGGVAFDGAPETTTADARAVTGADTLDVDTSTLTAAVIDSGVNTADDGSIFGGRVLDTSKDFISGEIGVEAVEDGNGHGSWVASCIAADPADADYVGYLPDADVLALRALNDDGSGSTADICDAIRYAADEGADVMCLSLGSPMYSAELDRALAYAVENGAIPVSAVGNDRQGTRWVASPGDSDHTIGVAATTGEEPAEARSAYFSNIGPDPGTMDFSDGETNGIGPDIAAPGMEMTAMVATTRGSTRTRTLSGTSMAAPCVVGVAGLVLAATSASGFEEVRDRLSDYPAVAENVAAAEAGHGIAHAANAVDQVEPDTPQEDAMTDEAQVRDESYRALSRSQGGVIAQYFL